MLDRSDIPTRDFGSGTSWNSSLQGFVERGSERIAELDVTVVATDDIAGAMEAMNAR